MTISVSAAADLVEAQLNIQSGATPPTNAMIQGFVRRGARRLIAATRPVFMTSAALGAGLAATVSGKAQILHVEVGNLALLRTEWRETTTGIIVTDYSLAQVADTANVWHVKSASIASDASTIDLDCIHGADWGFEWIVTFSEMACLERLAQTDASNAMFYWQGYRTRERQLEQQMAELRAARDADLQVLGGHVQQRAQFGRGAFRESGLAGFHNESDLVDRTAGER